jgi:hypothetical protein
MMSVSVAFSDESERGWTRQGRNHEQAGGADGREFYDQGHGGNVLEHGEASFFSFFIGGFCAALRNNLGICRASK